MTTSPSHLSLDDPHRPYAVLPHQRQALPFTVRIASDMSDLLKAVEVRSTAYGRHIPAVGQALKTPEPDDLREDVLVLVAESKLDGRVLGSIRLQPNFRHALRIEGETALPADLRGKRLVEFMRLTVTNGSAGRMVMAALAKASFEICHRAGIDYILVAGRKPVSLMYETMQFDDVLAGGTVALSYAAGVPHSIYCLPVRDADRRWRTAEHSLYPFMAHTQHPDIQVDYSSPPLQRFGARDARTHVPGRGSESRSA